ncbi:DNA-binding protein WhiA [Desulfovirgula thermocuniculi]|uniref:DNA-binding protein WhiA n=1 Tax=Desulfovirgula thermocuniculi TaxID=348842 RepID=UPI000686A4A2
MSFSSLTKNELARVAGKERCCRLAELAALVRIGGSLHLEAGQGKLLVETESAAVARKLFSLFKDCCGLHGEVAVLRHRTLRKNNRYQVQVRSPRGVKEILSLLGLVDGRGNLTEGVPRGLVRRDCCRRAYLRGAFLGGGSVSDPGGAYHLEVVAGDLTHARGVCRLMRRFGLKAGISRRKGRHVVYLKDGGSIADLLRITGAHGALLEFENRRVYKDMRNRVNRLVNCETANLNKTVNAALRQLENIRFLAAALGLDRLPPALRQVAEARLRHPDASLRELGEMLEPRASKSAVNHRLRRLDELARKLRETAGELRDGRKEDAAHNAAPGAPGP